ncbi:hypothetical protein ACFL0X_00225 [Nanoarchaeota archaeon]
MKNETKSKSKRLVKRVIGGVVSFFVAGVLSFAVIAPSTERFGYNDSFLYNLCRNSVKGDFLHSYDPLIKGRITKVILKEDEPCPADKRCIVKKGYVRKKDYLGPKEYIEYENPERYYYTLSNPSLKKFNISYEELREIVGDYHGPAQYGKLEDYVRENINE